jgi:hypothetical protein
MRRKIMGHKKYFQPVSYRFFQFVDELFHYVGIGYGTAWARKFCLWANREEEPEWGKELE